MEKFWAVILIFVVVAAAGLMYVNQVYIPQKETQMAMADMANQTLSAVKVEIGDDSVPQEVSGSEIKDIIEDYSDDDIKVYINGIIYDGTNVIEHSSQYYMRVIKNDGEITEIRFTKIV